MRFIYEVLATVALVACGSTALTTGEYVGKTFGGPSSLPPGREESDLDLVGPGQKVLSANIVENYGLKAIGLELTNPFGLKESVQHGAFRGKKTTLALAEGEHITGFEAHWESRFGHTIKYIKLTTNKGNSISGGGPTDNSGVDNAKEGYQLGGFIVKYIKADIATLAPIWTEIEQKPSIEPVVVPTGSA